MVHPDNRTTRKEVGTRDWNIAVTIVTLLLFRAAVLNLWVIGYQFGVSKNPFRGFKYQIFTL